MQRAARWLVSYSPSPVRRLWLRIRSSPIGHRVAKGAFWMVSGNVIARLLGLVGSILAARILGKVSFGELGTIQSTVGLFAVFAGFGIGITATKSDPIHHFESPRRSFSRMDFYGARNKVLYAWNNVPFPYFPFHLVLTSFLTSIQNYQPNRAFTRWRGVWDAYSLCFSKKADRRPVSSSVYRLSRKLKKKGPLPINDSALTNLLKLNGL